MNIIELFEKAAIYKENQIEFLFEDIVKTEKQFEIERTQNSNLELNLATNLISAMNDYPKEVLFISNNRILYNFFAKTNHSRNRFISNYKIDISSEAIKKFISTFLIQDLEGFFDEKLKQNRFDEIDDLLVVKEYLPEKSLNKLSINLSEKLDLVINKIDKTPNSEDILSFNFIKHRSFYDLLSQFKSEENDRRIKQLLDIMTSNLISLGIKTEFINPMMISMGNYKAVVSPLAPVAFFIH